VAEYAAWTRITMVGLLHTSSEPNDRGVRFSATVCAVRGLLNWQADREIVYARAPNTVALDGYPPFGHCSGFTDGFCNDQAGFANDDIFYVPRHSDSNPAHKAAGVVNRSACNRLAHTPLGHACVRMARAA
jgi:hypothetical protein